MSGHGHRTTDEEAANRQQAVGPSRVQVLVRRWIVAGLAGPGGE